MDGLRQRASVGRTAPALAGLTLLLAGVCEVSAVQQIRVPFGLRWGMSEDRISRHIETQPIAIAGKRLFGGREEWTLTGFRQENLARVLLFFDLQSGLQEVELQYQVDGWTHEKYRGLMLAMKRLFQSHYGTGRVVEQTRNPHAGSEIFVEALEWTQPGVVLRLMHFAVQRKTDSYDNLSVHYRAAPQ